MRCKLLNEVWVQADAGRKPSSWKPGPGICKQHKAIDEDAGDMKNPNRPALRCGPELNLPDPEDWLEL